MTYSIIRVAPQAPAPWMDPTGKPVPGYYRFNVNLTDRVNALSGAFTGIAHPTGGAVVDVQARAAIVAILAALGG